MYKHFYSLAVILLTLPVIAQAGFGVSGDRNWEGYAQTADYKAATRGELVVPETEEALYNEVLKMLYHRYYIGVGQTAPMLKMTQVRNLTPTNASPAPSTLRTEKSQSLMYLTSGYQWMNVSLGGSLYTYDKMHYQSDPVLASGAPFRYKADISVTAAMLEASYNIMEIDWFKEYLNNFWPYVGGSVGFVAKNVLAVAQSGAVGRREVDELGLGYGWHLGVRGQFTSHLTFELGYAMQELGSTKLPRVEDTYYVHLKADAMTTKGSFLQVRYWF